MFQVLDDSVGNYVNLKTVGKITSKDYDTLIPYLEESIKEEGPLNILCDMTNFQGMEMKAAWPPQHFRTGLVGLIHVRCRTNCLTWLSSH